MEKDLYFKILERLAQEGVGHETDLTDIFHTAFPYKTNIEELNIGEDADKKQFLDFLAANRHIDIKAYFDPQKIKATLTVTGMEFLSNHLLKKATIGNYGSTRKLSIIAIAVSIVAIAATVYTTLNDSNENERLLKLESQIQSTILQQKKERLPPPRTLNTSPANKPAVPKK